MKPLILFFMIAFIAPQPVQPPRSAWDIYMASRPAPYRNAVYYSASFVAEYPQIGWDVSDHGTLRADDFSSPDYHVRDGIRATVGQPADYTSTLWLFGSSTTFDAYVPDAYTLASQLQARIDAAGMRMRVVNEGATGATAVLEAARLRYTPIRAGDTVVFYDGAYDAVMVAYQRGLQVSDYAAAIDGARHFAEAHGAAFWHLFQPTVFTQPMTPDVQAIADRSYPDIRAIYAAIWDALRRADPGVADVSHALDGLNPADIYLDYAHLADGGDRAMARAIYDNLFPVF